MAGPKHSRCLLAWTLALVAGFAGAANAQTATAQKEKDRDAVIGSRTDHRDGTAFVSVGRKLPTAWDASIGADFNLAAPATPAPAIEQPLQDPDSRSTGIAWARTALPGAAGLWDKTTFEARVDPAHDHGSFGTRFSRSIPVGADLALSVEQGYTLHRPLNGTSASEAAAQSMETDNAVRLRIKPADATLSVSRRMSSADGEWLNAISAEKKLFGPLTVTGTVSEMPGGELNRGIAAGWKRTW